MDIMMVGLKQKLFKDFLLLIIIMSVDLNLIKKANVEDYPLFSLKGFKTYAKLLANYDGDTGDIFFIYKDIPMRVKARFYGYDCSEMKPALNDPKREEKKTKAVMAKKRLWELCTNKNENEKHETLIYIHCYDYDKYGRLMVVAYQLPVDENELFENSINNKMIQEGHGYNYYGGKKEDF